MKAKYLQIDVAILHGEEEIPRTFPLRSGDMWSAIIDIAEGRILGWPVGESGRLAIKVVDTGSYYLFDENDKCISSLENEYVPNRLIPGKYGDYIDLMINENGTITNWPTNPDLGDFNE